MVKLKRVYEAPSPQVGLRVLAERLWPRGLTRKRADVDLWRKDAAPTPDLKWCGHDPARREPFQTRYPSELREQKDAVQLLKQFGTEGIVTLLFAARDNGASALNRFLRRVAAPKGGA